MSDQIAILIYGAIGGGIVALLLRLAESYIFVPRFTESLEARKKLFHYGRPLWRACHRLSYRLYFIKDKMLLGPRSNLAVSPSEAQSLAWFTTREGNYITSTAYMIAAVAAWISLYERDVVFLSFGRRSLTAQFLLKTERFKIAISANGSILWFNYVEGIGEKLVQEKDDKIMSYSSYCHRLLKDKSFLDYNQQLFAFLHEVNNGQFEQNIKDTFAAINDIQHFLIRHHIVIEPPKGFGPPKDGDERDGNM